MYLEEKVLPLLLSPALVVFDVLILALLLAFVSLDFAQNIGFATYGRLGLYLPLLFGCEAFLDRKRLRVIIYLLRSTIGIIPWCEGGILVGIDDETQEVFSWLEVSECDLA